MYDQKINREGVEMNTKISGVYLFAMLLLISPVASAQMMGEGVMKGGQELKKEMRPEQNQKMHEMMGEMMQIMHDMMANMKGVMPDPSTKQRMDEMMKQMNEMMKQHREMMKGMGMMGGGSEK
jgi:hypothetical protein